MVNSKKQEQSPNNESYNDVPVHYCASCKSLKIMTFSSDMDYCDECGSTNIVTTHIDEYLKIKNQK